MAAKHTLHVALTEPLVMYVDRKVLQGQFATASEVVRAALRLLITHDEAEKRNPGFGGERAPTGNT